MRYKKFMVTLILLIFVLCCLVSVSASDTNDIAIESSNEMSDDVIALDENGEDGDNDVIASVEEEGQDVLAGKSAKSFDELQKIIDNASAGSEIELDDDYSLEAGGTTIAIKKNLTINGKNHYLDGASLNGIIWMDTNDRDNPVVFKNIKFLNGGNIENLDEYINSAGGAIYSVSGTLVLENCKFDNNVAQKMGGAVFSRGPMKIIDCEFNNNVVEMGSGGAVYCSDTVYVHNSKFYGNVVEHALSTLDMVASTFVDKVYWADVAAFFARDFDEYRGDLRSPPSGGAIFCEGNSWISDSIFGYNYVGEECELGSVGGAVYCTADLTVSNSSFNGNKAMDRYGGAILCLGSVNISDCDFRSNEANCGGAVAAFRDANIYRSTFIDNFHREGTTWAEAQSLDDAADEILSHLPIPGLSEIMDVVGLVKMVMGYLGVDVKVLSFNSYSDGGAVFSGASAYVEDCRFERNHASEQGGAISSRVKVTSVNSKFKSNKVFRGDNKVAEFFNWKFSDRDGGAIHSDGDMVIINSEFTSNSAPSEGGAVYSAGQISVNNSKFSRNIAYFRGGAIHATKISEVSNTEFTENSASFPTGQGGAIYYKLAAEIKSCNFTGNTAGQDGGAIYAKERLVFLNVSDCKFEKNYAKTDGGAIYTPAKLMIRESDFIDNKVKEGDGGAIYANAIDDVVSNSVFRKNRADNGYGGAIYIKGKSSPKFDSCVFKDNTCGDNGGAIYAKDGSTVLKVTRSNFTGNSAHHGGAIYVAKISEVSNSIFSKNKANAKKGDGGAIYVDKNCNPTLKGCKFEDNTCGDRGGAIYADGSSTVLKVTQSNFTGNSAHHGGAIHVVKISEVSNSIFSKNKADAEKGDGGAIYVDKSCNPTIKGCKFENNTCGDRGGAIFAEHKDLPDTETEIKLKLSSSTFNNNVAGEGGAIFTSKIVDQPSNLVFNNNKAKERDGGAIYINEKCNPEFKGCKFNGNTAKSDGGAIYFDSGSSSVKISSGCSFTNNTCGDRGGALFAEQISSVQDSTFINNHATSDEGDGGAIYVNSKCEFETIRCRFEGNVAENRGGAIYTQKAGTGYQASYCTFVDNVANAKDYKPIKTATRYAGQSVFNSGDYNYVKMCWFGKNNPDFTKGELAKYTLWLSDKYYKPENFLKIAIKINETNTIAGNPYKTTVYFYGTKGGQINTFYHAEGTFGGDGAFSNINIAKNGDMSSDVVLISGAKTINGTIDHQTVYLGVKPKDKDSSEVNIFSCSDVTYPNSVKVNYEILNMSNDASYVIKDSNGKTVVQGNLTSPDTLYLEGLKPDSYSITIINPETYRYLSSSANATFNVSRGNIGELRVVADNRVYPEQVKCFVYASVDGEYNVTIGGDSKRVIVKDKSGYVNFGTLNKGTYEAVVFFAGNELYNSISNITTFVVSSTGTYFEVDVNASETDYGQSVIVTHKLPKGATGNIKYYLSNGTLLAELPVNENLTLTLEAGSYQILANYSGDKNFEPDHDSTHVIVNRISPEFKADIIKDYEFLTGDSVTIIHKLANGATGTIRYYLSDGTFLAELPVNENYTTPALDVGIYDVIANYSGDRNFVPSSENVTFKVNSDMVFSIYLDDDVIKYDEITYIHSHSHQTATGTVEYYYKKLLLGRGDIGAAVELPILNVGVYEICGKYSGDKIFSPAEAYVNLTIVRADTKFNVDVSPSEIKYGENATITFSLSDDSSGNVTCYLSNGTVLAKLPVYDSFDLPVLDAGVYEIIANYSGDNNLISAIANTSLTINKAETAFDVAVENSKIDYGETTAVSHVLPADATGVISYYLGNGTFIGELSVNENLTLPVLNAGSYVIIARYSGDKNFLNATANSTLTVNKIEETFKVDVNTINYDETATVTHVLPADATGTIGYYLANGTFLGELSVNENLTLPVLDVGEYVIIARYSGDGNLLNATANTTLTINKANSTISCDDEFSYLYDGKTHYFDVTTNGATDIIAKINNKYCNCNPSNEHYSIGIFEGVGNYNMIITTLPDGNHNSVTKTIKVHVLEKTSTLDVDDVVLDYGDSIDVNVKSEGSIGITAKIGSENVAVNGYSIPISGLNAGTYNLTVTTVTDGNYLSVNKTVTITVNKVNSSLTADNIVLIYGETADVSVSTEGAVGITAKIGSDDAVVNGNTITIPVLDVGTYDLTVTTIPDDNHNAVTKTTSIKVNVNEESTKLTAEDVTATYGVSKYLTITLTDSQGTPLANATVTVVLTDAKNYTTDAGGQIKINISNLAPKTYDVTITFAGDDKYLGSDATSKVVVNKATPKITAKNKSFKTLTKTKKYTITLKDNNGKVIKNAKVSLKVNGKTYKATTNKNGKATFKITKLTKKGTHKAVITYKGNEYYKKVTKKVKITVKPSWKTVAKGSKRHTTVKKIQRALKQNGYYLTYNHHYLVVDGIYDIYTQGAVKSYQKANGLKVNGKVDEKTAIKLKLI